MKTRQRAKYETRPSSCLFLLPSELGMGWGRVFAFRWVSGRRDLQDEHEVVVGEWGKRRG